MILTDLLRLSYGRLDLTDPRDELAGLSLERDETNIEENVLPRFAKGVIYDVLQVLSQISEIDTNTPNELVLILPPNGGLLAVMEFLRHLNPMDLPANTTVSVMTAFKIDSGKKYPNGEAIYEMQFYPEPQPNLDAMFEIEDEGNEVSEKQLKPLYVFLDDVCDTGKALEATQLSLQAAVPGVNLISRF